MSHRQDFPIFGEPKTFLGHTLDLLERNAGPLSRLALQAGRMEEALKPKATDNYQTRRAILGEALNLTEFDSGCKLIEVVELNIRKEIKRLLQCTSLGTTSPDGHAQYEELSSTHPWVRHGR